MTNLLDSRSGGITQVEYKYSGSVLKEMYLPPLKWPRSHSCMVKYLCDVIGVCDYYSDTSSSGMNMTPPSVYTMNPHPV